VRLNLPTTKSDGMWFPHVVGYGTRCFHGDRVCYAETGSQALSFHYLNGYEVASCGVIPVFTICTVTLPGGSWRVSISTSLFTTRTRHRYL
jgi:hypothetical protein